MPETDWTKPLILLMNGSPVRCLCADRKFLFDERLTRVILINDPQQGEILASCTEEGYIYPGNESLMNYQVVNQEEDNA